MVETAQATAPITQPVQTGAAQPGKTATETPKETAARLFKLKVDGQDLELPESEVIALAQKGKSSDKRFQEAAMKEKQAIEVLNFLKANPKEAFKKLGIDVRKFSEDTLLEIIQQEQMSPEQKRAFENEQRLKQYEAQEKQSKERAQQEQLAQLERQHMENYDRMFVEALSATGLPKTAYTVKRMAELQLVNMRKGLNLDASQLAKIVKEDYINEQKAMYSELPGDQLMELLGKDLIKKISKAQLAKYKTTKPISGSAQKKGDAPKAPTATQSWKEFTKRTRMMK